VLPDSIMLQSTAGVCAVLNSRVPR